ncbi:MAG: dihydrodipicolinate synthase family protein [Rhodospirillaceae bacterium]
MASVFPRSGVGAAMITLFREDGAIDAPAMARLGRWLLASGCDFLLLFGTTGEGPSLSASERASALRAIVAEGVPAGRIVAGAGCAALTDTVALTAAVGELHCAGALIVPPFFFRQATQAGLRHYLDQVLTQTRSIGTPIALYHIPDVAGLGYDDDVIAALLTDHPGRIQGIKDSTGDKAHAAAWAKHFPGVAVYAGDDHIIRPLLAAGGAGPMTATAGLAPALVAAVTADIRRDPLAAPPQEDRLSRLWLEVLLAVPVTEAVKLLFAHVTGEPRWLRMRAPLRPLDRALTEATITRFTAIDDGSIAATVRAMPRIFL